MKKTMATIIALTLLSAASFAQGDKNVGTKIPECQAPFAACKTAGFVVGAHKKGDKEGTDNGLWVDCIFAVADGKKQVSGVDQAQALTCKNIVMAKKAVKK